METEKRVYCLYRVSTVGQVEKDDIPMQMDTQILYKSDGNYYIEEIIPGEYSDRGDSITHYQVSEEIAKYILSYIEIASN